MNVFLQVKEERNQVILDNEELQEQLDMSNTAQSAGNVKLNELKNEMIKVTEDLTRLECVCTTQEHELKALTDKLIDLNSVKETVKVSSFYLDGICVFGNPILCQLWQLFSLSLGSCVCQKEEYSACVYRCTIDIRRS